MLGLSDYKVNDIQDYLALIDTCSLALNQNHRILVCCGSGISRSNAVALGTANIAYKIFIYLTECVIVIASFIR